MGGTTVYEIFYKYLRFVVEVNDAVVNDLSVRRHVPLLLNLGQPLSTNL